MLGAVLKGFADDEIIGFPVDGLPALGDEAGVVVRRQLQLQLGSRNAHIIGAEHIEDVGDVALDHGIGGFVSDRLPHRRNAAALGDGDLYLHVEYAAADCEIQVPLRHARRHRVVALGGRGFLRRGGNVGRRKLVRNVRFLGSVRSIGDVCRAGAFRFGGRCRRRGDAAAAFAGGCAAAGRRGDGEQQAEQADQNPFHTLCSFILAECFLLLCVSSK